MSPGAIPIPSTVASVLLGIAILIALRWISGPSDERERNWLETMLDVTGWALIVAGCVAIPALLLPDWWVIAPHKFFGVTWGPPVPWLGWLGIPGWCWWLALASVLVMVAIRHATTRKNALLALLAVSAERSLPLGPAIEAFAAEWRGRFQRRVRRLAAHLLEGMPLPQALQQVRGVLPREAVPIIRVGYEIGALAPALRQAASAQTLDEPLRQSLASKIGYVFFVAWFIVAAVIFLMVRFVPYTEKIFKDFRVPLPASTEALVATGRFFGQWWFLFLPLILVLTALPLYVPLRWSGVIHWDFPGTGWLMRRLDTAAILDALALAPAHGRPILPALTALAETYPKRRIRRRLQAVADETAGGADWCEGLYRHGLLGRADLAVLQAAARVGNLAWAMREMADGNRRRFLYHTQALLQLLFPLVVLALGAVVMFIVVAMFYPLITLIYSLT